MNRKIRTLFGGGAAASRVHVRHRISEAIKCERLGVYERYLLIHTGEQMYIMLNSIVVLRPETTDDRMNIICFRIYFTFLFVVAVDSGGVRFHGQNQLTCSPHNHPAVP